MNIWFAMAVLAAVVIYASVPLAYVSGKRRAETAPAFGRAAAAADARRTLRSGN